MYALLIKNDRIASMNSDCSWRIVDSAFQPLAINIPLWLTFTIRFNSYVTEINVNSIRTQLLQCLSASPRYSNIIS